MKKIVIALALVAMGTAASAQYAHQVQGYTRSDGTYVAPHMQSNANGNAYDNYSSRPNVNPYTGREGTVNPYEAQQRENGYQSSHRNGRGW